MKNKILGLILFTQTFFLINSLQAQKVYGICYDGFAVIDINTNTHLILDSSVKISNGGLATGSSTLDHENQIYYVRRFGSYPNKDTLLAINISNGSLKDKIPISRLKLHNPLYFKNYMYGMNSFGGFEKYNLQTDVYTMLDSSIGIGGFAGQQFYNEDNVAYAYFSSGSFLATHDTVISIPLESAQPYTKHLISNRFIAVPVVHGNYIYGLDEDGFCKINYTTDEYTLLSTSLKYDPANFQLLGPAEYNSDDDSYIISIKADISDTLFIISLTDGSLIKKIPFPRNNLYNPKYFNGIINSSKNQFASELNIYPNPTSNQLNILSKEEIVFEIYSLTGKLLLQTNKKQIDISEFKPTMYILHAKDKNSKIIAVKKIVKVD